MLSSTSRSAIPVIVPTPTTAPTAPISLASSSSKSWKSPTFSNSSNDTNANTNACLDCICNRDVTKCNLSISNGPHLCLCQQSSTYYDKKLDCMKEVFPLTGSKYCKALYHYCRCAENGGTYECKRKIDHNCVCLIRGEYGQKKCIANPESHNCVCKMYSPDSCLSCNHICMCKESKSEICRANNDKHECACNRIGGTKNCRALLEKHVCTCDTCVKSCLAVTHICRCKGVIASNSSNDDKMTSITLNCRSQTHPCYCLNSDVCENKPHVCVCSKNPSRCKNTEKHTCVCNKFIGFCLSHKGKIY